MLRQGLLRHATCVVTCMAAMGSAIAAEEFQTTSSILYASEVALGPLVPAVPGAAEAELELPETPPLLPGTGTLPQPDSRPTFLEPSGSASALLAPGDFASFIATPVKPGNMGPQGYPSEPSVAYLQDTALLVANEFAAVSPDSGKTWQSMSPAERFPPRPGGADGAFGGDQRVLYIPSRDVMVWYIQYRYSATLGNGHFKLIYFVGRSAVRTLTPTGQYDVIPENLGFPAGRWFDFPDLAFSNDYLYGTSNVHLPDKSLAGNTVWRVQLDDLINGQPTTIDSFFHQNPNGLHSMRFTQGAGNIMRWASRKDTTTLSLFAWGDGAGQTGIGPIDRTVPASNGALATCPGPDGRDWAGFSAHRVLGGYLNLPAQEFGFLWDSAAMPGSGRPQPFVRTGIFRTTDFAYLRSEDTFSATDCYQYPAAAPNNRGHIGVTLATGSQTANVTSGVFIVDDFTGSFDGQTIRIHFDGTNGSPQNRWGDFYTVVPHPVAINTWVATGATMQGGTNVIDQENHSIWFGRERDTPAWVGLDVQSQNVAGVPISVDVTDRLGNKDGPTPFSRSYAPRQGYRLMAPLEFTDGGGIPWAFYQWSARDTPQQPFFDEPIGTVVYGVNDMGTQSDTAIAKYLRRRRLAVNTAVAGVRITPNLGDIHGSWVGYTNFIRDYYDGDQLTLTAPSGWPDEVQNVLFPNKITLQWSAWIGLSPFVRWKLDGVAKAEGQTTLDVTMNTDRDAEAVYGNCQAPGPISYSVVRGVVGALPVGPGGFDEVCLYQGENTQVVDAAVPAAGGAFWYLVSASGGCGSAGYGFDGIGTPRITTTCP